MDARLEWQPNEYGFEDAITCITLTFDEKSNDPSKKYSLHYHDHIEILYSFSGTAAVVIGKNRYPMSKGDMVIINAKYAHDVIRISGKVGYYVIKFLPEALYLQGRSLANIRYLLQLWQQGLDISPLMTAEKLEGSGIGELIPEIISEWEKRDDGFEAIIYSDIIKLFVWMVRNSKPHGGRRHELTKELQASLGYAIEAAKAHLDSFNTEDAAHACNLSYSYFSRSFKKAYGVTFSAYLESMRLREAERLLLTTDMSVTDIAAATGFATTSYFIERFRRSYGTTPRAFRAELTAVAD